MGITQENGAEAEKKGAKYLRDAGYIVVEMNEKGEQYLPIDLLATKNNITYAINVKSTQKDGYGLTQANIKGLTNTCLLANYVHTYRPEYIVNFAAQSEVAPSWEHPVHRSTESK